MTLVDAIKECFTSNWRQVDWRRTLLLVLLVLAVFAALWQYLMPQVRTIETKTFKRVPEIRKVREIQRVRVPCPEGSIVVLDQAAAADRLDLPGVITVPGPGSDQSDRTAAAAPQVTATAEIPETDNGAQAISVIDLQTGESTILVKEKEAPWFRFTNKGAAGIRYGINQRLQYVGNVYGKWDFLRVKDVYMSLGADLETGGDAHIQAGAEYRW